MAAIDDAIDSLTPEELALLNSDPEMLAQFKAKYSAEPPAHYSEMDGAADVGRAVIGGAKKLGDMTKAGYAGLADLVAGNGLKKSVEDINHVENHEDTTSAASTIGEALGSQVTPGMIAAQGAMGAIGEAIGPWVGKLLKGWAADAAVNAVGKIKSIAKALGVDNLDALGRFLLEPIQLGGKALEPIVTATSSPADMLEAANAAKSLAGKQLEAVSANVDGAISGAEGKFAKSPGTVDLADLKFAIQEMKKKEVGDIPNLGKAVAKQYDDALKDLEAFIEKQSSGQTETMFSELSSLKTKIGNLVYKHGSPLESKAALNDVYHAISNALDGVANKVGGQVGDAYAEANLVYHRLAAIVEGLEGKAADAKKLFDGTAFLGAMTAGFATHGPAAIATVPAAYVGIKTAEKYAPQAIAQGLDAASPLVAKGLELTARGIPVVSQAIASGLESNDGQ